VPQLTAPPLDPCLQFKRALLASHCQNNENNLKYLINLACLQSGQIGIAKELAEMLEKLRLG
jgi:hypothetical protein